MSGQGMGSSTCPGVQWCDVKEAGPVLRPSSRTLWKSGQHSALPLRTPCATRHAGQAGQCEQGKIRDGVCLYAHTP